ncbi:hypothetical protein [Tessaracoccus sp. G1721]
MSPSVGLYAWGGPGTIRLLRAKYRAPRIDEESFLRLYEPDALTAAGTNLGVTDMWVTYSWGFSDRTEAPDRQFLRERLPGFRRQGIRTHAYVQGLNVVTSEFAGRDIFCRDPDGRLLPYSRGRSLTCPNNPEARQIILDRVAAACGEDVDGVFVDNIIFGIPPFLVRRDYIAFFGCSCRFCRAAFQARFGYPLPAAGKAGVQVIADYLDFRRRSVEALLGEVSAVCRATGKQFGVNLYDPLRHTPEVYFGYRLADIAPLVDYHLIENHALAGADGISNGHLSPLIASADTPVFVVSYRQGIGFEPAYGAGEVDAIWSDAEALGYSPCLKVSEFTTNGVWHALDLRSVRPPVASPSVRPGAAVAARRLRPSSLGERVVARAVEKRYAQLATAAFENDALAYALAKSGFTPRSLRHDRYFLLGSSGA